MATLDDIITRYMEILDGAIDSDGEVLDTGAADLDAVEGELVEKVARILGAHASLRATADAERERAAAVKAHADAIDKRAASLWDWVTGRLAAIGTERYQAGTFVVARRLGPPKLDVRDEGALLGWLREHHPSAVREVTTVSVDKREALAVAKSGEELPGAEVVRSPYWRLM